MDDLRRGRRRWSGRRTARDAGHDVSVIARGPHLEAIRRNGLTLRRSHGDTVVKVDACQHPAETGKDVVVLAMKGQDTAAALDALVAAAASGAASSACRTASTTSARRCGVRRRVRRLRDVPAAHLEPGVVQAHSTPVAGILDIGRYPSGVDDDRRGGRRRALERPTFVSRAAAGHHALEVPQAADEPRQRGRGAVRPGRRRRRELVEPVRAEGEARAAPRPASTYAVDGGGPRAARRHPAIAADRRRQRGGGSSWQSLARGTGTIETDYLNGEIVLLGRLHGVPTPVNETARRLVQRAVREGRKPGSMTPAEFLEAVTLSTTAP